MKTIRRFPRKTLGQKKKNMRQKYSLACGPKYNILYIIFSLSPSVPLHSVLLRYARSLRFRLHFVPLTITFGSASLRFALLRSLVPLSFTLRSTHYHLRFRLRSLPAGLPIGSLLGRYFVVPVCHRPNSVLHHDSLVIISA